MEIPIPSALAGFLADCCEDLVKMGIYHLQVVDGQLQTWDIHRQMFAEVDYTEMPKTLKCSIEASRKNAKMLRFIRKRGEKIEVQDCGRSYLFNNEYEQIEIPKIGINYMPSKVGDLTTLFEAQGEEVPAIEGRADYSITGKEKFVLLGVYGGQLTSVTLPGGSEQFFKKNSERQMTRKSRQLFKSYRFLKFGEPDYKISLYKQHDNHWLLTTGQFGDGIIYRVLEKLTQIR